MSRREVQPARASVLPVLGEDRAGHRGRGEQAVVDQLPAVRAAALGAVLERAGDLQGAADLPELRALILRRRQGLQGAGQEGQEEGAGAREGARERGRGGQAEAEGHCRADRQPDSQRPK